MRYSTAFVTRPGAETAEPHGPRRPEPCFRGTRARPLARDTIWLVALLVAAAAGGAAFTGTAHAGAWTQDEGAWFLKIGYDWWVTSQRFDSSGKLVPYRDLAPPLFGNEFRSRALRVYAEYGLTPVTTVSGSGGYEWLRSAGDGRVELSSGLSDPRLQVRQRFLGGPVVASMLGGVKLPIRSRRAKAPALGTGAIDYGAGIAVGGALRSLYVSSEVSYLVRGGRLADQVPFSVEAGWSIRNDLVARAGVRGTRATKVHPESQTVFEPTRSNSRDLAVTFGVVLRGDPIDFAFEAEHTIEGRNALAGDRFAFSIWRANRPSQANSTFRSGEAPEQP